jgi:predicted amidohydrolase YtcJ
MSGLLLRDVEIAGKRTADVRIGGGVITEISAPREALERAGERTVPGYGGALLPGLADHHLHLLALAAARHSVDCSPRAVGDRNGLVHALRRAARSGEPDDWVRAVGYHESIAGPLHRDLLDQLLGDAAARPVRVQDRSGALWTVNGAGAARLALDRVNHGGVEHDASGRSTGRLWRADDWLRRALGSGPPPDLAAIGQLLAQYGVTAVTDATPELDDATVRLLAAAHASGALPQRLQLLGAGIHLPNVLVGPRKILLPDHDLPGFSELRARMEAAHRRGRPVAVHCVSREALLLTLAVLDEVGRLPGDRIEHAGIVPAGVTPRLRGLRVVTQPAFIADRGDDYRRDLAADDLAGLYPYASLLAARVRVAPSSDAPFGPADPWLIMRAARDRSTEREFHLSRHERVAPGTVLEGLLSPLTDPGGAPRTVLPGMAADLCLLSVPLRVALARPSAAQVRMTVCDGVVTHDRDAAPAW